MPEIKLKKIFKDADDNFMIDVQLDFNAGSTIALYGPSGSGKTSILRMIAGLLLPDEGLITLDHEVWYDGKNGISQSIQSRKVAMVFQGTSLFPHMSVRQNLDYAAHGKWDPEELKKVVNQFLLNELMDRNIRQISGGQKQRVELARAILRRPKILLLDEPFTALDIDIRSRLRKDLIDIISEFNITTILVTHDIGEVITMADKVYLLEDGKVAKAGKPLSVFSQKGNISNFSITGEIIDIRKDDILNIVSILVGKQIVKVAAHRSEIENMNIGDKVSISSKAFNPILSRLG